MRKRFSIFAMEMKRHGAVLFRRLFSRGKTGSGGGPELSGAGGEVRRRRRLAWVLGAVLAVWAAHSATSGLVWSADFHPDEVHIARWINQVNRHGYITERAYPSGWFELFRVRFRWDKTVAKWSDFWGRHRIEDGRVGAPPDPFEPHGFRETPRERQYEVQDGRDFNAWLYVLTAVFLFGACLEAGFHPLAAFLSGAFFLTAPGPLEFIHYCETDGGLLVSMAFFAWLAARALRKRSWGWALAASFAAGFAVACKFTLVPLLAWCCVVPAVFRPLKGKRVSLRLAAGMVFALVSLGLAFEGYLRGTPAFRVDPDTYLELMGKASTATYREICLNLGGEYTWRGATVLRLASLAEHVGEMGVLPFLWGVFAWGFWFLPKHRRQLAGIPGLLPVFFPFLAFGCPFVRRQELLPVAVMLSMGAGLPLHGWLTRDRGHPVRGWTERAAAGAAALLGLSAFCWQFARASGLSSCFQMRDTRAEAQNWLCGSLPEETPVSYDIYVERIKGDFQRFTIDYRGLPFRWDGEPPASKGVRSLYYVENVGFPGRLPIRDPRTGAVFPRVRESLAGYQASVFPVRTWGVSRATRTPVFVQPKVRLVSFERPSGEAFDVPVGHARPLWILPDGCHLYDAEGAAGFGPVRGVHTVRKRSLVHLNLEDGPRWLATRMLEGEESVRIEREGLFRPAKADLGAGGVVVAGLKPAWWERVLAGTAAHSTMRCRTGKGDGAVHCVTYLLASAAEAARELRVAGDAAAALDLLRGEGKLDAAGCVEAFLAAKALGKEPEAEWEAAARGAVAAADRLVAAGDAPGRADVTFCGVPAGVVEDFSRARLTHCRLEPGARLPLWLPPGRYTLSLTLPGGCSGAVPARLFACQTGDSGVEGNPSSACRLTAVLEVPAGEFLRVAEAGEEAFFSLVADELVVGWSPVERILEAAGQIRAALAG